MKRLFISLIKCTKALESCCNRNRALVSQLAKELRPALRLDNALTSVDNRLLSDLDELCNTIEGSIKLLLMYLVGSIGGVA